MQIINLLETLSGNTRFQVNTKDVISSQPSEIQELFITNDSTSLKLLLNDSEVSADRLTIFQI
jgi:hypothetical protein